ncbi:hypothetical protein niasHT_020951 [Heterodera trifolii]|uniref:Trehalase n=1 Tax=Heterodera trifolii TaxID=157864 RepID=A0ABD2KCK2_9BILA
MKFHLFLLLAIFTAAKQILSSKLIGSSEAVKERQKHRQQNIDFNAEETISGAKVQISVEISGLISKSDGVGDESSEKVKIEAEFEAAIQFGQNESSNSDASSESNVENATEGGAAAAPTTNGCSLNGVDLQADGFQRMCAEWPDLAPIYCYGKIIEAVNFWGARMLFQNDSKHFVDRPLKKEAKKIVEEFTSTFGGNELDVSKMNEQQVDQLAKFVRENFGRANGVLIAYTPEDWVENPPKLERIKDAELKKWAKQLNELWKELSRKMPDLNCNPGLQNHSLICVPQPFVVPGGRFREFYYWDAYWIVKGLIASGMTTMVKNMCMNFAEMVNRFGFVPNGGRIYYDKRSQPSFFTFMVYDYFLATNDTKFLQEVLPVLEKELGHWSKNRSVEVEVGGKKQTFYQYRADSNIPRPESFCQDVQLVTNISNTQRKADIWKNVASTAESGWDFSSRFMKKDNSNKANPWNLVNLQTTDLLPVDLNALICGNLRMLGELYSKIGDNAKASTYAAEHNEFRSDFQRLFYKEEHGVWYDFNIKSGKLHEEYYGSVTVPLFTRCYDTDDVGTAERMYNRLEEIGVLKHKFGVPTSNINSTQQWDFPNIWPSLAHMLIESLRRSGNKKMEEKAKELARQWLSANHQMYQNCGQNMWEKMAADTGVPGGGGEYVPQIGFGWTNGGVLDLLVTYGDEMTLQQMPNVECKQNAVVEEPAEFPSA